jgi:hypothetical protein
MAQRTLWHRRGVLKGWAALMMSALGISACKDNAFGFALVFESRSTTMSLYKFEWPGMVNKRGMFGGGAMGLSPRSPAEMSFMAEELKGIPEWIDLGWRSPIDQIRTGPGPNDYKNDFSRTKQYEQRVYPKSVVPQSVIDDVKNSRGKILKLHFIFDDSKAWVEYEVLKWR